MLWTIIVTCAFFLASVSHDISYAQEDSVKEGEAVAVDSLMIRKATHQAPSQQFTKTNNIKESSKNLSSSKGSKEELEKALAEAKAENEDEEILAKKIKLAKEMHNIRPTREQVDSAVRRAALKLPEHERASFMTAMRSMLNYNAIERISIDAMIETYSYKELKSMVEYFSKPEAKSASRKIAPWARKVQPEIVRMIDRAMMRIRTGQ